MLRQKELEKQITTPLEQIIISEDFCNWAVDWIKKEYKGESGAQMAILREFSREHLN